MVSSYLYTDIAQIKSGPLQTNTTTVVVIPRSHFTNGYLQLSSYQNLTLQLRGIILQLLKLSFR